MLSLGRQQVPPTKNKDKKKRAGRQGKSFKNRSREWRVVYKMSCEPIEDRRTGRENKRPKKSKIRIGNVIFISSR